MSTKELVTIGQRWERKRGKVVWIIEQVYRADREVMAHHITDAGMTSMPTLISFNDLRRYYRLLDV